MTGKGEAGEAHGGVAPRTPASSPQVQLELAVLADELDAAQSGRPVNEVPPQGITVLIVAGEADVRAYVVECLRDRRGIRVLEAVSTPVAAALAVQQPPRLLIVDGAEIEIVRLLPDLPVIVIVDEITEERRRLTQGAVARVLLARPFNARVLLEQLDGLLPDA
jgi:CheY-like chemotaxis protein